VINSFAADRRAETKTGDLAAARSIKPLTR